jgi:hypothetical protein
VRGSVHGRIEALEKLLAQTSTEEDSALSPLVVAMLDEYSAMGAMMSNQSYRGSPRGLVKIEPRDVAREHYGRDYSEQEFRELAIIRALGGLGYDAEQIDEWVPELLAVFEALTTSEGEGDT